MHVSPRARRLSWPVSDAALAVAYRQLASLLGSGLGARDALRLLVRRTRGRLREAFVATEAGIGGGATLAEAMAADPAVFPEAVRSFVVAGETIGDLPGVFAELAASMEFRLVTRRRLIRACLYPFIVYTVSLFVLPLGTLFSDGAGAYLRASLLPYVLTLGISVGAVVLVSFALRAFVAASRLSRARRRLPFVGPFYVARSKMVFARHLAAALRAGMEAFKSLELASRATGDAEVVERIEQAAAHVRAGTTLEGALERTGLFDDVFLLGVAGGEAAGHLPESLDQQARLLQDWVMYRLDVLLQMVAVAVLLVVGAFAAWKLYEQVKGGLGGTDLDELMKQIDPSGTIPRGLR
jgi:type II secretory pathway component PulF